MYTEPMNGPSYSFVLVIDATLRQVPCRSTLSSIAYKHDLEKLLHAGGIEPA